jgi:hypothetical protein
VYHRYAEAAANAAAAGHTVDDGSPATYFYFALSAAGGRGVVCRGDDIGTTSHLYEVDAEVSAMLHFDGRGHVVTVGLNSMLSIHEAVDGGALWRCQSQMKLPSEGAAKVVWATPGTLAVCNEKDPSCAVRMFNLGTGENYALLPPPPAAASAQGGGDPSGRRLTCLAYNSGTAVLACGQKDGHVTMFRFLGVPPAVKPGEEEPAPEDAWQNMAGINVMGRLAQIAWWGALQVESS